MRYLDVPLEDMMQDIVDAYVQAYKTDFDIDLEAMSKCKDCIWVWLVRRHGTYLFPLTNCFTRKHFGHVAVFYYAENELNETQAFIVEQKDNMMGDVYNITLNRLREVLEVNAVELDDACFAEKINDALTVFKKEYRKQRRASGWESLVNKMALISRVNKKRMERRAVNET